jgi:hypothetical protein
MSNPSQIDRGPCGFMIQDVEGIAGQSNRVDYNSDTMLIERMQCWFVGFARVGFYTETLIGGLRVMEQLDGASISIESNPVEDPFFFHRHLKLFQSPWPKGFWLLRTEVWIGESL